MLNLQQILEGQIAPHPISEGKDLLTKGQYYPDQRALANNLCIVHRAQLLTLSGVPRDEKPASAWQVPVNLPTRQP